jgi:glucose/arabinose dehydrogenase
MFTMKKKLLSALILALAIPAYAQQAPAETPPPPSWKQGMSEKDAASPLHPFAPVLAGVDAKDLPINTLKAPPGFKVEVWMDGVPNARSLLISPKGTVFVSNRIGRNVYAIVDKNGKREYNSKQNKWFNKGFGIFNK